MERLKVVPTRDTLISSPKLDYVVGETGYLSLNQQDS